jgi:hypothetical protein
MSENLNEILDKQENRRREIRQQALFLQGASLAHFGQYEEARRCFQKLIGQGCPWGRIGMRKLQLTIDKRRNMTTAEKAAQKKRADEIRQAWLNGMQRKFN